MRHPPPAVLLAQWLQGQLNIVTANEEGVLAKQVLALHDMRVAARRLRTLLRAFRPLLAPFEAPRLETEVKAFSDAIGAARDLDVWIGFLRRPRLRERVASDPLWSGFLRAQREERDRIHADTENVIASPDYAALKQDLRTLIDALPSTLDCADGAFESACAGALLKTVRQTLRRRRRCTSRMRPEDLHDLRKACRRARYLCEFFASSLDLGLGPLGKRLKRLQDVLGNIHDLDVWYGILKRHRLNAARALRETLRDDRRALLKTFRRTWEELAERLEKRDVERRLRDIAQSTPGPAVQDE